MLLKKLELLGFKSFPEKLRIEFGPGVTCVVGPNGCGKTNISDAIRWVLGEQSAKALRGGSMGDVIFNGTARRKPVGMAEVTLTFANSGPVLPMGYEDVSVSRRIYRDGTGEYFLNKTLCRLKDVRDTFFDTGVGTHAYSLIEQEMVDNVLSDQSGQRRFLFEEAAGITKYKARKREALLKLEATETDLVRVNDILVEIEREANSLRRQIAKARRFKRLEDEIKSLDLALGSAVYKSHDEQVSGINHMLEQALARREEKSAGMRSLEASLEGVKLSLLEEERRLNAALEELAEVEENKAKVDDGILVLRERRQALGSKCEELREDIRRQEEKIRVNVTRWQETSSELAAVEAALAGKEKLVKEKEKELTLQELKLVSLRSELDSLRDHLNRGRTQETHRAAKTEELLSMKKELERQLAMVQEETVELDSKLGRLRASHSGLASEMEKKRRRLLELETKVSENEAARKSLEEEKAAQAKVEARLLGEAQKLEGLLGALERTAVDHGRKKEFLHQMLDGVPGEVVGLLEDLVTVPTELCAAFDAILYEYGMVAVVRNKKTARQCFDLLKDRFPGRFSMLVVEGVAQTVLQAGSGPISRDSGGMREAVAEVECTEELRQSLRALLGNTFLVEATPDVERISERDTVGVKLVSRDGGMVVRGTMLTGGKPAQLGSLEAKAELARGGSQLEGIRASLLECQRNLDVLSERGVCAEQAGRELSAELANLRQETSSLDMSLSVSAAEMNLLEGRLSSLAQSKQDLEARLSAQVDELRKIEQELSELRRSLAPMAGQFETQSSVVSAMESQREGAMADLGELRMSEVREFSRKNGLISMLRRLEEEKTILESEVERKSTALRDSSASLESGGGELVELEQQAAAFAESENERRSKLDEVKKTYSSVKADIEALEQKLKTQRRELEQCSEEVHSHEMDLTRQRIEREGVVRRMHSEYGVDLTMQSVSLPEGFEPNEAEQRLEDLKQRLRGLGPVNLLALEEYEARKERLDFMKNQRDDLLQAKASLREVIEKINQKASAMFIETFNSVQEKFQRTFGTLFEGGAAELRLVGDDPLEAGIEIVARPKGKTLQSLNLLSGGEKALTVIALLFAIYLVKPSPFCILDEVDAPLDDANIQRFVSMLKTFNERTQFIVITHNKKTMEAANCLYGITMQEPGVSKVVSVRLREDETARQVETETVAVES